MQPLPGVRNWLTPRQLVKPPRQLVDQESGMP
jgi:hypothetical protein